MLTSDVIQIHQLYFNTGCAVYFVQHPSKHVAFTKCFNVAHRLRRWPSIETALGDCPVLAGSAAGTCYAGDALLSRRQKGHFTDTSIQM